MLSLYEATVYRNTKGFLLKAAIVYDGRTGAAQAARVVQKFNRYAKRRVGVSGKKAVGVGFEPTVTQGATPVFKIELRPMQLLTIRSLPQRPVRAVCSDSMSKPGGTVN